MLVVFTVLSLLLIALGILIAYLGRYWCSYNKKYKWNWDGGSFPLILTGSFCLVGAIIGIIILIGNLVALKPIDNKISYLEQNNAAIEERLYIALETYCEHENKTLVEISPDNPEVIFILYPELKTNDLFEFYIDTLVANNNELKQLNITKLNEPIYKWWLYFGS